MSIPVNVSSINEVDADLQKYVSEQDGQFLFDNEKFKSGLIAERNISANLRAELTAYKNLGMSVDEIRELAEKSKQPQQTQTAPSIDQIKYLEMQKELELAKDFRAKYEAERAKVRANTRDKLVRELIRQLPDEFDKDRLEPLAEEVLFSKFELNEAGDALNAVGDKLPSDYIAAFANAHGFKKTSTAGNAKAGNANINVSGRTAAYNAAKEIRDYGAMINSAPELK